MAFLHNKGAGDCLILGRRKSKTRQKCDYLVQSPGGQFIIAHGWDPVDKCWEQGNYYGWGKDAEKAACRDFYGKPKKRRKR